MFAAVTQALNNIFLDGRFGGQPLYLVLDKASRQELANVLGVPEQEVDEFCCKSTGEALRASGNPYVPLEYQLQLWNAEGCQTPPPFTALLFTLAHAAELMASTGEYSSGNYYRRLEGLTGVEYSRLSQFGRATEQFWSAFSSWLVETDYRFGRPTARPINQFKYVSLAISQAIVRAGDRECFHHLFDKFGFSSTDTLTPDEMNQYIESWIRSTAASPRLKAAWQKQELRFRICEVALAELESWVGASGYSATRTGRTTLSLAIAVVPDFPRRKLALSLGQRAEFETDIGISWKDSSGPQMKLGNSLYGALATISPPSALDWQFLLRCGGTFISVSGDHQFAWRSRLAIPFSRSEDGPYWTESSRTTLGVDHIVLARADARIRRLVEEVLSSASAPGYTVATPDHLVGLPSGWVLYEGVRLIRPADDAPLDVASLAPVSEVGTLQVEGGMRLYPGIWHESAPPLLVLESGSGAGRIDVHQGHDADGALLASCTASKGEAKLLLEPDALSGAGLLFVRGTIDGRQAGTRSILLRSAAEPMALDRRGRDRLAYLSVWSASAIEPNDSNTHVEGLSAYGIVDPTLPPDIPERFGSIGSGGEAEEAQVSPEPAAANAPPPLVDYHQALKLPCTETGIHVWKCETLPPGYPARAPASMECKSCGRTVLTRNRGAALAKSSGERNVVRTPVPPPNIHAVLRRETDHGLILDGLCFIGAGTWASFEAAASADVEHSWEAMEIARKLTWLGHADISRRAGSGRITRWSIAPPSLGFAGPSKAILAGFRNKPLIDELATVVAGAGGSVQVDRRPDQPPQISVSGIEPLEAPALFGRLKDPHGRCLKVVLDAPLRLAQACKSLGTVLKSLTPIAIGRDKDAQFFDLARRKWIACEAADKPGAFRFQYAGNTYVYRDRQGRCFEGPHEVVKLLAARDAGTNLHAYIAQGSRFESVLGCEPIGLLGRALVACSGRVPSVEGGKTLYENVPPAVAAIILQILYPEGTS